MHKQHCILHVKFNRTKLVFLVKAYSDQRRLGHPKNHNKHPKITINQKGEPKILCLKWVRSPHTFNIFVDLILNILTTVCVLHFRQLIIHMVYEWMSIEYVQASPAGDSWWQKQ